MTGQMAGAEFFKRNEDQAIDWLSILAGLAVTAFLFSGAALAQDPVPMTVEADDLLEWNQTEGIYTATGNAVAVQGARTIRGDVLVARYDPDAETQDIDVVIATGDISFEDETTEATGSKLVYNITSQDYSIDGPKARVSGRRGVITASKLITLQTADDKSQTMTARGNAVYRDSTGRLFAGDLLVALFDSDGSLQTIDAEGAVTVTTEAGRKANGDAATYSALTEQATLTGNVVIVDGESTMSGGRAEVDFKSGNSRMLSSGNGGRVSGVLVTN
ncbi:MAG: LptA/OstA family protein [Alphaproteobacteria bacterium]